MDNPEAIQLKEQLMAIVRDFTVKAEHPQADLLKSSLSDLSHLNDGSKKPKAASAQEEDSGAQSLWLGQAISIASKAMNIADGIGTYSDKISKVANFVSGPVANKLDKWGMGGLSEKARKTGQTIDKFTQEKIKPLETKVAKAIAPVVKSKTFQAVRRTLNVVSGALSLRGGLKALGMAKKLKLPRSYKALKASLKKATAMVKNRKQVMKTIRNTINKGKQIGKKAYKTFKRMKLKEKYQTFKKFKSGISGIKKGLFGEKKQTSSGSNKQKGQQQQQRSGRSSGANSKIRGGGRSSTGRSKSAASGRSSSRRSSSNSSGRSSTGRSSSGRSSSSSGRSSSGRSSGGRSSGGRSGRR